MGEGESSVSLGPILVYDWDSRLWVLSVCRWSGAVTEPYSGIGCPLNSLRSSLLEGQLIIFANFTWSNLEADPIKLAWANLQTNELGLIAILGVPEFLLDVGCPELNAV